MQSLISDEEVKELVRNYGMIIVDERHHVPAVNFEKILSYAKHEILIVSPFMSKSRLTQIVRLLTVSIAVQGNNATQSGKSKLCIARRTTEAGCRPVRRTKRLCVI